jgi:hypothetical protein
MKDAIERTLDLDIRAHVVADELPMRMARQMRDVRRISRDKIVHPDNRRTGLEQPIAQVRAEKPGRACYEDAHAKRRPMLS